LESFADQIVGGAVDAGATRFMPMLVTAYQKKYPGIYNSATDIYMATYASGIESYFPGPLSYSAVATSNIVPDLALFNVSPSNSLLQTLSPPSGTQTQTLLWSTGFGSPFLVNDNYRLSYLGDVQANPASGGNTPGNALRVALKANDLTKSVPAPVGPTMLCGGGGDPVVYYTTNTSALKGTTGWTAGSAYVTEVNMDTNAGGSTNPSTDPFYALKTGFTATYSGTTSTTFTSAYTAALGAGQNATQAQTTAFTAVVQNYHTGLVPFCFKAAAGYFAAIP
jgi:hypothetical protein